MKKVSLWKLAALFGGLVVIFVSLRVFRSPGLESNLPASLTEFDSAKVTELVIVPAKAKDEEIHIAHAGSWKLVRDGKTMRLDQGAGVNAVRTLMGLKPERIVSKRKEKWEEFGVGDSTGTRIRVMAGNSVEAALVIGRTAFNQMAGQRYGGTSYTFVRVGDEPEVYTVEGFLETQFNRTADEWRDKSLFRIKKDSVDRIVFQYPSDSSFVLERRQGKWMVANQLADSAAVVAYLNGMEFRNGTIAAALPAGDPFATITFTKASKTMGTLEAWQSVAGTWFLRGSVQPDTYFATDPTTGQGMFKGAGSFLAKP